MSRGLHQNVHKRARCPFCRDDANNGTHVTKCCSGLCIDLLRKFEDELGFSYDLVRASDPKWGTIEVREG